MRDPRCSWRSGRCLRPGRGRRELRRTQAVSDPVYARAVAKFGEQGVIDTVSLVGYYTLIAMVLNTARTPLPAGATPALAALPK